MMMRRNLVATKIVVPKSISAAVSSSISPSLSSTVAVLLSTSARPLSTCTGVVGGYSTTTIMMMKPTRCLRSAAASSPSSPATSTTDPATPEKHDSQNSDSHGTAATTDASLASSERAAKLLHHAAALRRAIYEIWTHPEDAWDEAVAKQSNDGNAKKNSSTFSSLFATSSSNTTGGAEDTTGVNVPALPVYAKQSILARRLVADHAEWLRLDRPRTDDITRALGEAFDRLLLMQLPLPDTMEIKAIEQAAAAAAAAGSGSNENAARNLLDAAGVLRNVNTTTTSGAASAVDRTVVLKLLLDLAAKSGRELSVRTIQHLFSRCADYPEAMALLYTLRFANINMTIDAYYAMIFALQRLEEEGWALRHREELLAALESMGPPTPPAGDENNKNNSNSSAHNSKNPMRVLGDYYEALADFESSSGSTTAAERPAHPLIRKVTTQPQQAEDAAASAAPVSPAAARPFPLSEAALNFILYGTDEHQLLPESKPWIGQTIATSESSYGFGNAPTKRQASGSVTSDYDAISAQWTRRLKQQHQ